MSSEQLKILVVDDDPFVRAVLTDLLEASNYQVENAVNGLDALKKCEEHSDLNLIISDMNMDEMNGLELVKEIRKRDEYLPFIVLTVNTEIQVALEAIRGGANDYLLKDENIQETISLSIENVLENHRLKLENMRLMEDLARKNRELERLSFLDGLTGIANRRYFDMVASQEWRRAVRESSWISFLMIDIDHFKGYNDTYGHQGGDECLRRVAEALNANLKRSGDLATRYGGEEFAIILPNTDTAGAEDIAEEMLEQVRALNISHSASSTADFVTVSLGVASAIPQQNDELADLLAQADKALYEAKMQGRNQKRTAA